MERAAAPPPRTVPPYLPQGNEREVFECAHRQRLPLLLKGPTGCGKTRFVRHMAALLDRPLFTVSCHDELSAADLIGRYLLHGDETVWQDGPLTRAVRDGGICYLDEVVEARKDTTVILHPLTDDRRELPIEKTGEVLHAPPGFMLVVSYNPVTNMSSRTSSRARGSASSHSRSTTRTPNSSCASSCRSPVSTKSVRAAWSTSGAACATSPDTTWRRSRRRVCSCTRRS